MAISKKGLRKIIVDNHVFYWKFNGNIFIISEEIKSYLLIIDFGWYDVWLFVNDKENRPPDFKPKSVTPKFVNESISYALNHGWTEGKVLLEFRNGNYTMKK